MKIEKERLWRHLSFLCKEIGPRLSGTPADERSVAYIASHFEGCGAQVEVQDFPCPGWEHEGSELILLNGAHRSLPVFAQTFTNGCDVEADLAVVGLLHDLEFRADLEGKIFVLHGEVGRNLAMDRNPTLLAIEERRPAAAIIVSSSVHVSTKLVRDPFHRVSTVAVPPEGGATLMASEGQRARLKIRARRYESTSHNVIGSLPGERSSVHVMGWHPAREAAIFKTLERFPECETDAFPAHGSDHVPFYIHHIPAVYFEGHWRRLPIHSAADTIELMGIEELGYDTAAMAAVIAHLAEFDFGPAIA